MNVMTYRIAEVTVSLICLKHVCVFVKNDYQTLLHLLQFVFPDMILELTHNVYKRSRLLMSLVKNNETGVVLRKLPNPNYDTIRSLFSKKPCIFQHVTKSILQHIKFFKMVKHSYVIKLTYSNEFNYDERMNKYSKDISITMYKNHHVTIPPGTDKFSLTYSPSFTSFNGTARSIILSNNVNLHGTVIIPDGCDHFDVSWSPVRHVVGCAKVMIMNNTLLYSNQVIPLCCTYFDVSYTETTHVSGYAKYINISHTHVSGTVIIPNGSTHYIAINCVRITRFIGGAEYMIFRGCINIRGNSGSVLRIPTCCRVIDMSMCQNIKVVKGTADVICMSYTGLHGIVRAPCGCRYFSILGCTEVTRFPISPTAHKFIAPDGEVYGTHPDSTMCSFTKTYIF